MSRRYTPTSLDQLEGRKLLSSAAPLTGATPPMPTSGVSVSAWMNYYGFNRVQLQGPGGTTVAGNGAGETVAIVDWNRDFSDVDSTSPLWANSALYRYSQALGLPTSGFKFTLYNEYGGSALPAASDKNAEFDLDVEAVHAAAPLANIVVVVPESDGIDAIDRAIRTAVSLKPQVVSMSFDWPENPKSSGMESVFPGGNGVSYVVSSGDSGGGVEERPDGFGGVSRMYHPMATPGDLPMVVQVGGTLLKTDGSGRVVGEVAWGNNGGRAAAHGMSGVSGYGSRGGVSEFVPRPSYQANSHYVKAFLAEHGSELPSGWAGGRLGPDVSMMSMPGLTTLRYSSTKGFYWTANDGGTSLATPLFASVVAIADQGRTLAGKPSLSSLQTLGLLYQAPASVYHDVTSGGTGYPASPGFDLVTGLGSPRVPAMVRYLTGGD